MKYTIKTEYREPYKVVIEFDSVEELNAAITIVTLYNFDVLYKLLVSFVGVCYYQGAKDGKPALSYTTYWTDIRLIDQLERLDNYLRRSYESI